jgi:2-oxoglutarate dehydrogenase E1 component
MAVNTTVEVVMPQMGDSVSEGTVLEWHKNEGDQVSLDETLVEISTDKVDAEVPAPITGTVVKVHAAEGDTVSVGSVLAEIAPTNGDGPARADAPDASEAGGTEVEIVMPAMGESVTEGVVLEWHKQPGDAIAQDETIVEISTDKVDAEVPAPAAGTMGEILADAGDTVEVGQVLARMMSGGNGSAPSAAGPKPTSAPRPAGDVPPAVPDGARATPVAARTTSSPPPTAPHPTARARRRPSPRTPPCSRAPRRRWPATWTSRAPSRRRPPSARSPSRCSTAAASSSRPPASASPSPT